MKNMFSCPMHPEIVSEKKGRCPKCGMDLVKKGESQVPVEEKANYMPLFIIVGLILLTSLAVSLPELNIKIILKSFMAGFFITFAGFKLVDLKGFAQGYSTYDLLAKRWFTYGYIYPFLELLLGILMIISVFESEVLIFEIILMTFSGVGVLSKILKKEKFQCVCLGTFLKVPLTKVTLIEDFGMVLLGIALLTIS